jgi:hypothetical protein
MDQRVENRKALTDAFCRAQPAPASGRLEFADLRCAGLSFRITSKGSRTFCFRFRDPVTHGAINFCPKAYRQARRECIEGYAKFCALNALAPVIPISPW